MNNTTEDEDAISAVVFYQLNTGWRRHPSCSVFTNRTQDDDSFLSVVWSAVEHRMRMLSCLQCHHQS